MRVNLTEFNFFWLPQFCNFISLFKVIAIFTVKSLFLHIDDNFVNKSGIYSIRILKRSKPNMPYIHSSLSGEVIYPTKEI